MVIMQTIMNRSPVLKFKIDVPHYSCDGNGRDGYILYNHGGMMNLPGHPDILIRNGRFGGQRKYSRPAPALASPPIGYRSDGSGRDYYVTVNSGGQYYPYRVGRIDQWFPTTLRTQERPATTQTFYRNREKNILLKRGIKAKDVTARLFAPADK